MNLSTSTVVGRRGFFTVSGVRAAAIALIIAIALIAAVALAFALAPGGALSNGTHVSAGIPAPIDFDRTENAPQR